MKRKGHLLNNPTEEQKEAIMKSTLSQARMEQWVIAANESYYKLDDEWPKRPLDIVDTIVISATNNSSWGANEFMNHDTSDNNDVTPGKPLPGITCHLFINSSGHLERTSDFKNILLHTPGVNTRSLCVMIQYGITGNSSAPPKKIMNSLENLLVALCLELKLNPQTAIIGQSEAKWKFLPWLKGHRNLYKIAPGTLLDMDSLRKNVTSLMKKKLKYAQCFNGEIDYKFGTDAKLALNSFNSESISFLYRTSFVNKYHKK